MIPLRNYLRRWRPDVLDYCRANAAMRREGGGRVPFVELLRLYPRWVRSLRLGLTPLSSGVPWLTFRTIDFLTNCLRPDMTVFEFGSGGSTIFIARRVRTVVSIEHDPEWHS